MKCRLKMRLIPFLAVILLSGCAMQTKEVFTINPDLSGKCVIEVKMFADTTRLDAALTKKDSLYGIIPGYPDFHKIKFTRRDAIALASKIIGTKGVEVWNSIRFGMSKKRDMIYFSGVAYFRDVQRVHFSMLDSVLKVSRGQNGQVTFALQPDLPKITRAITDEEANRKVSELRKNAFYIRPVLADQLNPTEATVIYNLPGTITNSSIFGQQGDNIVQLTLTGNEILRYADSLNENQQLAVDHYKSTNGTNAGVMEPLFNRIVWEHGIPAEVTFTKNKKDQFDYNQEVQNAMMFFDDFMAQSKLQKYDSTTTIHEEREEKQRPKEYGMLLVNKADSAAKKPYFIDMTAIQSHDTITISGELSEDIKAEPSGKIHIMKLIAGAEQDITDSIVAHTKISADLTSVDGKNTEKAPKRKVSFIFTAHFPSACKEVSVQGRLTTELSGKPGTTVPFKIKQVAVISGKRPQ
jgi:hypothetical protein